LRIFKIRWEKYTSSINPKDDLVHASKVIPVNDLSRLFPFHGFFSNAPQPLFKGESFDKDYEAAEGCWRYIQASMRKSLKGHQLLSELILGHFCSTGRIPSLRTFEVRT